MKASGCEIVGNDASGLREPDRAPPPGIHTDIKQAPWYVVPSDDKKAARLNCISHLLSQFDYEDVAPDPVELPQVRDIPYVRPPLHEQTFVPLRF